MYVCMYVCVCVQMDKFGKIYVMGEMQMEKVD